MEKFGQCFPRSSWPGYFSHSSTKCLLLLGGNKKRVQLALGNPRHTNSLSRSSNISNIGNNEGGPLCCSGCVGLPGRGKLSEASVGLPHICRAQVGGPKQGGLFPHVFVRVVPGQLEAHHFNE